MKKLLASLFTLIVAISSIAQDKPFVSDKKNVLKINSLSLFVGTGSIFYERRINEISSAQLGVAYLSITINDTKFTGLLLTPEYRFYLQKNAISGFYVAPYFRYQRYSLEAKDNSKAIFSTYGGGAVLGMQWIFQTDFNLDLFFGGNYSKGSLDITSGADSFNTNVFEGFRPRVGLALGFAF